MSQLFPGWTWRLSLAGDAEVPVAIRHHGVVKLDGWNYVPRGYGLQWDLLDAPLWLRAWFRFPILERFAYPIVVRRGFAWLTPHRGWNDSERDEVPPGWLVGPARTVTAALRRHCSQPIREVPIPEWFAGRLVRPQIRRLASGQGRSWLEAVDTGEVSVVEQFVDPGYVDHNPPPFPGLPPGIEGARQAYVQEARRLL